MEFMACLSTIEVAPKLRLMGRKKISARPKGKRAHKPNMVAAAVELAGGAAAVAKLCGVRRQSVYWWIKEWKVERLVDALKLSQASGIPVEKFAGQTPTPNRPGKTDENQEPD
jgi:hypothetical protein